MGCDQEQNFFFFCFGRQISQPIFIFKFLMYIKNPTTSTDKRRRKETHMSNMSRVSKRKRKTYS